MNGQTNRLRIGENTMFQRSSALMRDTWIICCFPLTGRGLGALDPLSLGDPPVLFWNLAVDDRILVRNCQ